MYRITIYNDNSISSDKERIYYRSTGVNTIQVLVDQTYKDYKMKDFTCLFEYRMPISHKYVTKILTAEEALFQDEKVQYLFPIDSSFTSEQGELELSISFIKLILDADGNKIEVVRKVNDTKINIIPTAAWEDYIPSTDLGAMEKLILELQGKIEQEKEYAEILAQNKVDDIKIDNEKNRLVVSSKGETVGEGIDLNDLGDILADTTKEGLVKVII